MPAQKQHPLVAHQPLRLFFQLSYTIAVLLRLPYYAIISLVPSLRPIRSWTARQTFMSRLVYPFLDAQSRVGITETFTLEPGSEGPLASTTTRPAKVGGTWFPNAPDGDVTSKTVVLYFHGGAFVQGDGRTAGYGSIAKRFLDTGTADAVFSLQYWLSGHGGLNPFPAALQDALSSYVFLLDTHFKPHPRRSFLLHEFGSVIHKPNPKCAILVSPRVEPFYYDSRGNPHRGTDFIPGTFGVWGAHSYAGTWTHPNPEVDPYITLSHNPFFTPIPMFVSAGTAELIFERITEWVLEMRGIDGNSVELYNEKNAVHDTFFVGDLTGFADSAWLVAAQMAEFVKKL